MPVCRSIRPYEDAIGRAQAGFSLVEVMLACGIFGLFSIGLFALFRSGQMAGNQSYWLQRNASQMQTSFRKLTALFQKSSFPSTIVFPGKIIENTKNEFKVHISQRKTIVPADAKDVQGAKEPGTHFLRVTTSLPEKKKFESDNPALINYHIYSLTKSGKILYHRYSESVSTTEPLYIEGLKRTRIPSEDAALVESAELIDDVQELRVNVNDQSSGQSVTLEVICANPKGHTKRSEMFNGIPNVGVFTHPFDPDW